VTALILLSIGSVILPLVGWLGGVILLWVSEVWSTRDKLLGTLVVPGGLGLPFWLLETAGFSEACVNGKCTGGPSSFEQIFWPTFIITLAAASLATTIYLAVRMRRLSGRAVLA
jgi:hypothetical protein